MTSDPLMSALPLLELPLTPPPPNFDGSQLCAQTDPELFFPHKGGTSAPAKRICGRCEFLNPCRRYALTARGGDRPVTGVWGGTSERDRQRIRRAMTEAFGLEDQAHVDVVDDVA